MKDNKTPCYFYKEENAIVFENTWNDDDVNKPLG